MPEFPIDAPPRDNDHRPVKDEDELWSGLCRDLSLPRPEPAEDALSDLLFGSSTPVADENPVSGGKRRRSSGDDNVSWQGGVGDPMSSPPGVGIATDSRDPLYWFAAGDAGSLAALDADAERVATTLEPDAQRRRQAMAAALNACYRRVLALFDPDDGLRPARAERGWRRLGARRRQWRDYCKYHQRLRRDSDSQADNLFESVFLPAYEQRLRDNEHALAVHSPTNDIANALTPPIR
ncbi:type VI secretion system-associated FHA domain protein [Martelella alba]|uniref:Type VI secretion system FHA domain-containing protein n=1 Tax=Martelella alba TaxID=2590451 RepID=A0ABY2SGP2_9HYPH|nr:type VI secretion system-associated FHA domain protein [Martelella alba]TKI04335.1 hypothetical protein FCN80_18530 [Martelella alba]